MVQFLFRELSLDTPIRLLSFSWVIGWNDICEFYLIDIISTSWTTVHVLDETEVMWDNGNKSEKESRLYVVSTIQKVYYVSNKDIELEIDIRNPRTHFL